MLEGFTPEHKAIALYDWRHWAREKQLAPEGDWTAWLVLAGRGWGKTRTGAEWFRHGAEARPGGRGMLLSSTPADARDVMILGTSGIMSVCPPWNRPIYEPSKRILTWPNGFIAVIRSAHNPEAVRGPEHHIAWPDELAAWPATKGRAAYDNMMFGLRLGENPQVCITSTPKPVPLIRELITDPNTAITKGSTYENEHNLAPSFLSTILAKYEGTNLGRQEIHAELLDESEGALWTRSLIDETRVTKFPDLVRIVVGVDPSGGLAEIGIVGAGIDKKGHVYVLCDVSLRGSPREWAEAVVTEYWRYKMDRVIAERNYGGEMVESTIRMVDPNVSYKGIYTTRGKLIRAEPVAALMEKGKLHLVGHFPALEGEMTNWVPGESSPNRLDAMVWAVSELAVSGSRPVKQREIAWG